MPRRNYNAERAKEERTLRRIFIRVMRAIAGVPKLSDIDTANPELVMRQLDMDSATIRDVLEQIRKVYVLGGDSVSKAAGAAFDLRSAAAAAWLEAHGARLVQQITSQQRRAIARVIEAGAQAGKTPRQVATDIVGRRTKSGARRGGIVGLSEAQAGYVINAQRELAEGSASYFSRQRRNRAFDGTIRRRLREGQVIPAALIQRATAAYADNLLQLRGETIAQTETLTAYSAGRDQVWRQAVEKGRAQGSEIRRVWRAVIDSRTRDQHADMDGQEVGFDEPFVDGDGNQLMFPGDTSLGAPAETTINCRCFVSTYERPLGVRGAGIN